MPVKLKPLLSMAICFNGAEFCVIDLHFNGAEICVMGLRESFDYACSNTPPLIDSSSFLAFKDSLI